MEEYRIINNYVIFEEADPDSLGTSFRAGEIQDRKAVKHCLLTNVYPFFLNPPNVWRRVHALIEGIRNQNIPGLLHPEKIIEEADKSLLIYPFINGKSLAKILEDASKTQTSIELELIFAIVFGIADVLDSSSAIIVNKKRTFHGVLTPDNIVIDFDGKISLKNYGIFPYLRNTSQLLTETVKKFNDMLAPELINNENLTPQSDIYHLGNIIYRLLTGKYFQYSPGNNFEALIEETDLEEHIFLPEEKFAGKITELFKRTLNPDPNHRFSSIKEFKEYISNHFHIEELSSSTFMLAYFMNLLYKKTIEQAEERLAEELSYTIPETKPVIKEPKPVEKSKIDDHMIEDLLIELEQQKRSKVKLIIPFIIILILVLGIAGYLYINQQKEAQKQQEAQLKSAQDFERRVAEMKAELLTEYQKRLKAIEEKAATTEEEKEAQADEIARLKKWRQDQEEHQRHIIETRKSAERKKTVKKKKPVVAMKTTPPKETFTEKVEETPSPPSNDIKVEDNIETKDISKPTVIKTGDIIPLDSVTFSPSKMSGTRKLKAKDIQLSNNVLKKYSGRNLTINAEILVNEFGSINDTKIKGNLPKELATTASDVLKSWTYIPAEKDKTKVKVWIPAELTIAFEGKPNEAPTEKTSASPSPHSATASTTPSTPSIVPLDTLTYKPSKMKGKSKVQAKELNFSSATMNQFKGRTLSINASILINEHGGVSKVNIKGNWPSEIKSKTEQILKSWSYIAGEKDKTKVKVWLPVQLTIAFGGPPKSIAIDTSKLTNIVPLNSLTFRPSKLSGKSKFNADDLNLPKEIKRQYKDKTITINASILLDEGGRVITLKLKGNWPNDIKFWVTQSLMKWEYIPAEKDKKKVKVWLPVRLTIKF